MLIIDSHCHAGLGDGLTGSWDTRASLKAYQLKCDRLGIAASVLFSCFHSDYQQANRSVASIVRELPGRRYGYAFVHPQRDRWRAIELIGEAVAHHRFVGIKSHRHDGPMSRELCEAARAFSLPVLYDVMGEIWRVDVLAEEFPDVNFIIPHLGTFADDWRAQQNFMFRLARYPNVFTDTSGVRRIDYLRRALDIGGPEKLLFGSDGPFLDVEYELVKVKLLRLPNREAELVLSGNWLRLTSLARRRLSANHGPLHPPSPSSAWPQFLTEARGR